MPEASVRRDGTGNPEPQQGPASPRHEVEQHVPRLVHFNPLPGS